MAHIEGSSFKCGKHEFDSDSIEEFNAHCLKYPDDHYEQGVTACMNCGAEVYFDKLPFHPIDPQTGSKNISLRCEDCEERIMGGVKRSSVKPTSGGNQ